jgi:hypothetical protein
LSPRRANHQKQLATVRDATKREHDPSSRGKSGHFDHRSFEMRAEVIVMAGEKALVRAIAGRHSIVLLDDALAWLTELPKLPPTSTPQRATGGLA